MTRVPAFLGGALLLGALSLGAAQVSIPALPPSPTIPVPPAPKPSPFQPATPGLTAPAPITQPAPTTPPAPQPTQPAPAQSTPVQSAPAAPPKPAPAPARAPAQPARPVISSAPLLIGLNATYPAIVDGRKTQVSVQEVLTIPGERARVLRGRGEVTESLWQDVSAFAARFAAPQDTRFLQQPDGRWAAVQRNGLKVDLEAARQALARVLSEPQGTRVNLTVTVQTPPARTLDYFFSRGITAFLGTGFTSYEGSSPARVTNIHVGARNFKDRLFEGKTFSFNSFIGPVSAKNGYVPGLVIAGDQTASGVGGGICQVSTTVFRTLYGAGLPVVQRQNHSYQVFYYDPQGLDATIYQPQLDLKFANDTGGALWFQSEWNDQEATLTVSVFGKARDFAVVVDEPRVLKTVPSPADRLIYDKSLKRGERKQVDWAAPGATIEVTRRFVRGGKTFKEDVLRSVYRPWPNIFRVGTG